MKRGKLKMEILYIIKNTTTNELLVGTQLEWNLWLYPGYALSSPEMILYELKKKQPEYKFEIVDLQVQVKSVRALLNSLIK